LKKEIIKIYWKFIEFYRTFGIYRFEKRKCNSEKVCFILAGYKPFLYDSIFSRIINYIPNDIDVCLLSSGKYDSNLSFIAENNNWSYLSTKRNSVSLIQNIAIKKFKNAKYIYKLDEDIFVTNGYFDILLRTFNECTNYGNYKVGFVAPLIPINGYGNYKILEKLKLVNYYTKKFERPLYATGRDRKIENDPSVAKFFWGHNNIIPSIDEINYNFSMQKFSYDACPIRFSIGAILFSRELWKSMHMFKVKLFGPGMGLDEEQLCCFCLNQSKAIIISNNTVVGHLSFGNQNKAMEDYYIKNKNVFMFNKKYGGK
jgi:hypothetical protein